MSIYPAVRPARSASLDGLRGVAVVAVMLFHFNTRPWFTGGFIGVDVFFVLSGFLITRSLMDEWAEAGTISLRRFYARRALRLMPAALLFFGGYLAFYVAWNAVTGPAAVPGSAPFAHVGLALAYVFNWYKAMGDPETMAFTHIWSLSVEEQFYLLWPGCVLLMLRLGWHAKTILASTMALAVACALLPVLFAGLNWPRLYYATDYRAHELLIGSAAAHLYYLSLRLARNHPMALQSAFAMSAAVLIGMFGLAQHKTGYMLAGGFTLTALASAVVVLVCAAGGGGAGARVLGSRPLVYLGQRSYALYLWHFPIAWYVAGLGVAEQLLVASALSLAAAELSYRVVERRALARKDALQSRVDRVTSSTSGQASNLSRPEMAHRAA
jgi:peptidoglycan/LPS O-acetylase OafA/YrhL